MEENKNFEKTLTFLYNASNICIKKCNLDKNISL
jgi:hypothetical protein